MVVEAFDSGQGAVGLDDNVALATAIEHLTGPSELAPFDLVDGRNLASCMDDLFNLFD